jgi:glycosyl hydrolase family 25
MTSYVTDWSNHNSGALTQSQANGLVGFWHKCTDGDHWYADPYFKSHCDMARSLGVDSLGGYHVLWGNRDLVSQAHWFVDRVRAQAPDAIVFMSDNEPFGYNVAPSIDQVNAFNQAVADYAQVPASSVLAYCPQWHYGSAISGLRFPWIQSNYGSNPTGPYATVYQQTVGDGSSRWNGPAPMPFLQYGSRTDVGDANAFRGDAAAFFAFLTGGSGGSSMLCKFGDKSEIVRALQYQLLSVRPDILPRFGADADYGQETADAVSIVVTGGDGRTYGAQAFATLQTLVAATHGPAAGGLVPHTHPVSVSVPINLTGTASGTGTSGAATPA